MADDVLRSPARSGACIDQNDINRHAWQVARRDKLRTLNVCLFWWILGAGLMTAAWVGPAHIVLGSDFEAIFAPLEDKERHGIRYIAAYGISWAYLSAIAVVWRVLHPWQAIVPLGGPDLHLEKYQIVRWFYRYLLPGIICTRSTLWFDTLCSVIYHAEAPPLPLSEKRTGAFSHFTAWGARALLLGAVFAAQGFGYFVLNIARKAGLLESNGTDYFLIVIPALINLGIMLGAAMQTRCEDFVMQRQVAKLKSNETSVEGCEKARFVQS